MTRFFASHFIEEQVQTKSPILLFMDCKVLEFSNGMVMVVAFFFHFDDPNLMLVSNLGKIDRIGTQNF